MTALENDPILDSVPVVEGRKKLDQYFLERQLGRGGMGAVYLGHHETLGSRAAVKCLMPSAAGHTEEQVERFWREARIAANIESPNLIHVRDLRVSHGLHYMVMEFIDGESAEERSQRVGPMPPREALTIVYEASRGLAAAHANDPVVIHRDVKPQNIMISKAGDVKVADLGIARIETEGMLTMADSVFGTPHYMPPEQFGGAANAIAASDVYSMGATLYFLLTAQHPYTGLALPSIIKEVGTGFPDVTVERPDLPQAVVGLLRTATALATADRPRDARELARETLRVLDELGGPADLAFGTAGTTNASRYVLASASHPSRPPGAPPPTLADGLAKGPMAAPAPAVAPVGANKARSRGFGRVAGVVAVLAVLAFASSQWIDWNGAGAQTHAGGNKSEDGGGGNHPRKKTPVPTLPSAKTWAAFADRVLAGNNRVDFLQEEDHCRQLVASGLGLLASLDATVFSRACAALRRLSWAGCKEASQGLATADGKHLGTHDLAAAIASHDVAATRLALAALGTELGPSVSGEPWLVEAVATRAKAADRSEATLGVVAEILYAEGLGPSSAKGSMTVLHRAAENGDADVVRLLLRHGADPTLQAEGRTPLHIAALAGSAATCQILLDPATLGSPNLRRQILTVVDSYSERPIEAAAESLDVATCTLMIKAYRNDNVPLTGNSELGSPLDVILSKVDRTRAGTDRCDDIAKLLGAFASALKAEGTADLDKVRVSAREAIKHMSGLDDPSRQRLDDALAPLQ